MASRFDELTIKVGGSNPLSTSVVTGITRSFLRRPTFEQAEVEYGVQRQWLNLPSLYGVPSIPPVTMTVWFKGAYTGASTDPSVQARALEDDWAALLGLFTPYPTPIGNATFTTINFARKDVGGNATSRDLLALPITPIGSPSMVDPMGEPLINGIFCANGNYNAFYHMRIDFMAPLGYWRDSDATSPSVNLTTSPATQSIGGGGWLDAGLKIVVTAKTGSPTAITVSGGNYSAVLKAITGNLAVNDAWDFYYTTDGIAQFTSNATITPGGFLLAPRTAASFSFTLDAGTATIACYYKPFRASW